MNHTTTICSSIPYQAPHQSTLSQMKQGERAQILGIDPDTPLCERFGDVGLHPGTHLQCVRIGFLGDPVAYRIEGTETVLAIRRRDAAHIHVYISAPTGGGSQWD